jgi:hypothetical protein
MHKCDQCGREFKNAQGLKGHRNYAHSGDGVGATPGDVSKFRSELSELRAMVERMADGGNGGENGPDNGHEPHTHGGDPHCQGCLEVARHEIARAYQSGRSDLEAEYKRIPGMVSLKELYEEQLAKAAAAKAEGQEREVRHIILH